MDQHIILFVAIGFAAQLIDGALGMASGVTSTSFLLTLGVSPTAASTSVRTAEIFASAVSGISHLRFGDVDRLLFSRLLMPAMIGGILGALVLISVPGDKVKPFVAIYLLLMGVLILGKVIKNVQRVGTRTKLGPLGLMGGFLDSIGERLGPHCDFHLGPEWRKASTRDWLGELDRILRDARGGNHLLSGAGLGALEGDFGSYPRRRAGHSSGRGRLQEVTRASADGIGRSAYYRLEHKYSVPSSRMRTACMRIANKKGRL